MKKAELTSRSWLRGEKRAANILLEYLMFGSLSGWQKYCRNLSPQVEKLGEVFKRRNRQDRHLGVGGAELLRE